MSFDSAFETSLESFLLWLFRIAAWLFVLTDIATIVLKITGHYKK